MQIELDALRLMLAKEDSFSPERRYLRVGHSDMIPLLIYFQNFFQAKNRYLNQHQKDFIRHQITGYIIEKQIDSFYDLTYYQTVTIAKYLQSLNEESHGKATEFLEYLEGEA
jgi:hypothetical protein